MIKLIMLSYFDNKIGPKIFCSYPKIMMDIYLKEEICRFIDLNINGKYIIFVKEDIKVFNFSFEITSKLSRGGIMNLALSIIMEKNVSLETENKLYDLFILFKNKIIQYKEIDYAFFLPYYPNSFDCNEKKNLLKSLINELYDEIKRIN